MTREAPAAVRAAAQRPPAVGAGCGWTLRALRGQPARCGQQLSSSISARDYYSLVWSFLSASVPLWSVSALVPRRHTRRASHRRTPRRPRGAQKPHNPPPPRHRCRACKSKPPGEAADIKAPSARNISAQGRAKRRPGLFHQKKTASPVGAPHQSSAIRSPCPSDSSVPTRLQPLAAPTCPPKPWRRWKPCAGGSASRRAEAERRRIGLFANGWLLASAGI